MRAWLLALGLGVTCLWQPAQAAPAIPLPSGIEALSSPVEVRSGSGRPRTQSVRGYTRQDGRHVSAYRRAPPRR
jgi:hypothetical protein